MRRLVVVLSGLLILPAFAEVAPLYYDANIEMMDTDAVDADVADVEDIDVKANANVASATAASNARVNTSRNAGRTSSSRAVATGGRTNITNVANTTTRNLSARSSNNVAGVNTARATVSRAGTTRAGTTAASRATTSGTTTRNVVASRNLPNTAQNTTARAATTGAANPVRASIIQTDTVNTPLYTGRVGMTTGVRARVPSVRMASSATTTTTSTAETKADTVSEMDELAQMTDYCKAQYTQCMDNFCNVLDDNQGRCSCSTNLKNYSKTETALKQATESLQDVAQQIQYIGLSKDEIETLFSQTEAELKMQSTSDNSQMKNDLDRIKNMIVDVKSGTASVTDTGMNFDLSGLLDFSISSTGFDLGSLFGTNNSGTASISNQRGEQLYKTATARCKAAVLNSCSNQGVDVSVITNSYDLEIDKQCIAYERSLSDANDQMSSTVRNAKSVLQKARLMVAQQKNAYDLRGCVNALDTCMQDEFVCGSDYENCLDPTGKYIVNGEVVVGGQPGVSGGGLVAKSTKAEPAGLYSVWDYSVSTDNYSAFGNGSVAQYVEANMNSAVGDFNGATNKMAKYLQQKIGYANEDGKNFGMCISVLNKCQDYTYTSKKGNTKIYNPNNDVVRNYLERVSMQIKAAQDEVLASYAESCISEVASCLSQNNYTSLNQVLNTSDSVSAVAVAACRPAINTCMSVTGYNSFIDTDVYNWLKTTLGQGVTRAYGEIGKIDNQIACLSARGTWSGTKCSCPTNSDENYGLCLCKDGYAWNESNRTCTKAN